MGSLSLIPNFGDSFTNGNLSLPLVNFNETFPPPDYGVFDDNNGLQIPTAADPNDYINTLKKINNNYNNDNDSNNYKAYHRCQPDNPRFNCTEDEFIKYARGPQQIPIRILVTIIFGATFVTGVVGNVIVCIVIVRQSTMHTATNYYLFSLAVSDLMFLLLGLPYEISLYWHQYPYSLGLVFCKLRALVSEASTYVSVLTIVAFSMERFLAICHPLHLYAMSGFKRALRIIAALWVISFFSAIPFAIYTNIDYLKYPVDNTTIQKSAFCAMLENPPGLHELSFCLFFVIPMVLIIVLYGRMGIAIRSRKSAPLGIQTGSLNKESRHQKSRKAVVRMLAAVVITFFICWAPFHAQRLLYLYAQDWKHFQSVNEYLFFFGGWFYYVTCTINPILYNVMSHRYRVAFKETLCGKRRGSFYSNGFARDQASFRTTIASSGTYDRVQSMRIRSIPNANSKFKDRESSKSNNSVKWRKSAEISQPTPKMVKNPNEEQVKLSNNVVVVVDISINGRPKVYTENSVEENLLKKNETYI